MNEDAEVAEARDKVIAAFHALQEPLETVAEVYGVSAILGALSSHLCSVLREITALSGNPDIAEAVLAQLILAIRTGNGSAIELTLSMKKPSERSTS